MIHSFRLRLALLSAVLSGLALAAFSFSMWWLMRDIQIEQLDRQVRAHAERETHRAGNPPPPGRGPGHDRMASKIIESLGIRDNNDLLVLIQDGTGQTLYRSAHWPERFDVETLPWPAQSSQWPPPTFPPPGLLPGAPPGFAGPPPVSSTSVQTIGGDDWRIGLSTTDRARVAIAVNARIIEPDMARIRQAFYVALPLALLMIGLGSWFFSNRAMQPLEKLIAATRRITAKGLDHRISAQGEYEECVEVINGFNFMLERLERSFKQAQRFSGDAAHELKTPLAILQGQLERAIAVAGNGSSMQADLTSILDEVRRLSSISSKLLLLSLADAGQLKLSREPFCLSKVLADLVEDTRMLAPQLSVAGEIDADLLINADASLLRQVLHNLISNAIKYNVEQGWISITTVVSEQTIEVVVSNASSGIAASEHDKIFERFYRIDPAHSRQIEGVGLGLSVSREIARAHGGDLTIKASSDNTSQFVLRLPR
jgi:signal transduction histidine kinase